MIDQETATDLITTDIEDRIFSKRCHWLMLTDTEGQRSKNDDQGHNQDQNYRTAFHRGISKILITCRFGHSGTWRNGMERERVYLTKPGVRHLSSAAS